MTNAQIAQERGLTLNPVPNTYYDQDGNEYRDEDGRCLVGEDIMVGEPDLGYATKGTWDDLI